MVRGCLVGPNCVGIDAVVGHTRKKCQLPPCPADRSLVLAVETLHPLTNPIEDSEENVEVMRIKW